MTSKGPVYTIGHSNHEISVFMGLLARHDIQTVADVRSAPYSRFHPQFCREALEDRLRHDGVDYVFLGRELGARSDDPACYADGRVQYDRLAETDLFRAGLARVEALSASHRITLMCSEREPLECHRTLLVARALVARGFAVAHILGDGTLESHAESMLRLLDLTGVPRTDLFRTSEQLQAEAVARQEARVAYTAHPRVGSPG